MYCRRNGPRLLAAAGLALLGAAWGCRQAPSGGVPRLALLPFENLTADSSLNWIGAAAPGVIASQLAPVAGLRAFPAAAVREAYAARANQVLHGTLTAAGGRWRLTCVIEDLSRHRVARTVAADGGAAEGVLPLLDKVARSLAAGTRPFPSRNEEAVRLLALATEPAGFAQAAAADPDLPQAYIGELRWQAVRGRREEALKVLAAAQARQERFPPIERAELSILAANLAGDFEARRRSLAELASLTPSDSQPLRSLGQLEYTARRFDQARNWYQRALAIEPDGPDLWNMLGYAQAYAGDFPGARKSLSEGARLAPADPNFQDSLGEIHFMAGDFAAAETAFQAAYAINAAWRGGGPLLKAAWSRVMTGDVADADAILSKYIEQRKSFQDPLIPFREAQWEFVTGRRRQAMERLARFRAAAPGEVAAHAGLQLAVWLCQTGNRAGARKVAQEAAQGAVSPPGRRLAAILLLVTDSPAPASEWAVRAARAFSEPADSAAGRYALAYALLLDGHFPEAAVLLNQMLRSTPPPAAGDLETLAAWALVESGRLDEARALARIYPPPEGQGEPTFASLAMPRVVDVHARLAAPSDAARLKAVYEKLKGDVPDAIPSRRSGGN